MAWRIAGDRLAQPPMWQYATAIVVTVSLLVMATLGALLAVGSPPRPTGPLTNGPIVVANALGWRTFDAETGAASDLAPCDGRCEEAIDLHLSPDGRTVYFVDPSPLLGDLRSDRPGWAIWRWDRQDGNVSRVVGCEPDCVLRAPTPSPDGRYLSYVEDGEVVVIDAEHAHEIRRFPDPLPSPVDPFPFWDATGHLYVLEASLDGVVGYRGFDVTTGEAVAAIEGPVPGFIGSSPDGSTTLLTQFDGDVVRISVVADSLEHTRPILVEQADYGRWFGTWAPDGSAIAV